MKRTLVFSGSPMEEIIGFARAVRVGPHVTIGGTAPIDSDGKTIGVGDMTKQAVAAL